MLFWCAPTWILCPHRRGYTHTTMGKKGGGKKGGKGKGGSKGGWEPREVPDGPVMAHKPPNRFFTIQVKGVVWKVMDFIQRVPASTCVFDLKQMIVERHGEGVREFTLYKEEVHPRNLLNEPSAKLEDLEFSVSGDDPLVIYYDFEPRVDDCPLLLRPPHDLRVLALEAAEEAARREKAERYAALKGGSSHVSTVSVSG